MLRRPVGRVGRPSLIGTAARTAVIAGTATATSNAVQRHSMQKQAAQQAATEAQQVSPQAPAPQPTPAPAPSGDLIGELQKLAALKESGMLSDDEFAAAKAKLLTS